MANSKDLISILMPVKNAGPYLKECLESIFSQSYSRFELLVVNDHSTDNSFAILTDFATRYPNVIVLNNTGKGIIDALQLAYKKSSGTFITRMDADDKMPPQKLELMHALLKGNGRNFVATGLVAYFSENGVGDGYKNYETWLNGLCSQQNNFTEIYKECVIPSPCWMLHREDLDRIGAFDATVYPEDYDLCFRMYKEGLQVAGVNEICHYWRDHQDRASRNDPNYTDNRFLSLKIANFLTIDWQRDKRLVLWGAGKKGKAIATALLDNHVVFDWICDNDKKIGKEIYDVVLQDSRSYTGDAQQIIIAVANEAEQQEIRKSMGNCTSYFFC